MSSTRCRQLTEIVDSDKMRQVAARGYKISGAAGQPAGIFSHIFIWIRGRRWCLFQNTF